MTLKQKRKIKSMIAEIIACTLIAIATADICVILIKIASLIVVHLTYEQFKRGTVAICIVVAIIAVMKLLREPRKE